MLRKVIYWLLVFAVSIALVVALILFLESRDPSSVDSATRLSSPFSLLA